MPDRVSYTQQTSASSRRKRVSRAMGPILRQILGSRNRRQIWSYAYKVAKTMMPTISPTERAALNAGTVGFDRNIFSGNPTLKDLRAYAVKASPEEQAFLDKEVAELCELLDDHQVTEDRDFPEEFWTRCKKQGFFGMIIPKQYGGKGFSAHGHSQVRSCRPSGCIASSLEQYMHPVTQPPFPPPPIPPPIVTRPRNRPNPPNTPPPSPLPRLPR